MGVAIIPFVLVTANQAASVTDGALNMPGDTGLTEYVMPFAGAIVGISVNVENPRTAGTLTAKPTKNGTNSATLSAVIDGTNTQRVSATQTKDAAGAGDTLAAGDRVGVKVTTDAAWAAGVTPSVQAVVFVQRGLSET